MFTSAEIIFYDNDDNSNSITLTDIQIYTIRKILGLDYDYNDECFSCYDDESLKKITEMLFKNLEIKL